MNATMTNRDDSACCVYIAGSGRNGSTLLGMLLEQQSDDVFFAGELTHLWQRGLVQNQLCACGQAFRQCEFWAEVIRTAFGDLSERDLADFVRLRNRISRLHRVCWICAGREHCDMTAIREYNEIYRALLTATAKVSGSSFIVDSSKYPTDLATLTRAESLALRVIHLVRNCNAVVYSWKRKKTRPEIHWKHELMPRYGTVKTAVAWRLFNSAIAQLGKRERCDSLLVRYEELVDEDGGQLTRISEWLGAEKVGVVENLARVSHSVSGNPTRFQSGVPRIAPDFEWQQRLSAWDRRLVSWLCGDQQRDFGYV